MAQTSTKPKKNFNIAPGSQARKPSMVCMSEMAKSGGKSIKCHHQVQLHTELSSLRFSDSNFSKKVFMGGFGAMISKEDVRKVFENIGVVEIPSYACGENGYPLFCYLIMESSEAVSEFLEEYCTTESSNSFGEYYLYLSLSSSPSSLSSLSSSSTCLSASSPLMKKVEVIPWELEQSSYCSVTIQELKINKRNKHMTVFVGGLHGMVTARGLAGIMNKLFGRVAYVDIDTDMNKYPIGSARVTFKSYESFMAAVKTEFMRVKTSRFDKLIQIDPYIENSPCSMCTKGLGLCFCRNLGCLKYYCHECWEEHVKLNNHDTRHQKVEKKHRKLSPSEGKQEVWDLQYVDGRPVQEGRQLSNATRY